MRWRLLLAYIHSALARPTASPAFATSARAWSTAATERVRRAYAGQDGATADELDGLTITSEDWRFNLRPSNTEPLLRLNVEADNDAILAKVTDDVLRIVRDGD